MFPFIPDFVPDILQITPLVLVFCYVFAPAIRKYPIPFYAFFTIAVAIVSWFNPIIGIMGESAPDIARAAESWYTTLSAFSPGMRAIFDVLTSSHTGVAFYLVVMFIGALEPTPTVKRLLAIRTEMSIIGGIIIFAHCVRVIELVFLAGDPAFQQVWGEKGALFMFLAYGVVGSVLTVIWFVLWITSFRVIRRTFRPGEWKKLQRLAYPFMALTVAQGILIALAHLLIGYPFQGEQFIMAIMLQPTAWLSTFAENVATAAFYLSIGIAYLVLRLNKNNADKRKRARSAMRQNRTKGMSEG